LFLGASKQKEKIALLSDFFAETREEAEKRYDEKYLKFERMWSGESNEISV
jgi:hypothetical protein